MVLLKGKNNYSKKKILKLVLWLFAIVWISFLFFHGNCFAADETTYNILNISQMLSSISQFVYVLIWPVLVVAWAALDNSLIYGSFLNLDAALRNLRNIMKNFANFALWFLFIFSIAKTLFGSIWIGQKWWWDNPMSAAKTTVTNTLLAWIFIQMSWFIVAMLIDLSTVLIYAVWWLPISMLSDFGSQEQEIENIAERPVLKLNTKVIENWEWNIWVTSYYSYWDYKFSPCYVPKSIWWNTSSYIVWRKYLYLSGAEQFYSWHCSVGGVVYKFVENDDFFNSPNYCNSWSNPCSTNSGYFDTLQLYIHNLTDSGTISNLKSGCKFISLWGDENTLSGWTCEWYGILSFTWGIFAEKSWFTLSTLLENAKSYIWPFITLYSSILEYGEFMNGVWSTSTIWWLFSLILNTFFVLVLFIPVAILMVLLIIRVWILWVVIAISPIIVLVRFFWNENWPLKELANNDIFKKFNLENIVKQIFAPVLVVFAISMSIVFLTALAGTKPTQEEAAQEANTPLLDAFGINREHCDDVNKNKCDYNILGLVSIKIDVQANNYYKDIFVWCLMMLLSTWIVRFFLKFAIEFMSETWKKLMKSSSDLVKNIPIVPLPSGWAVGLDVLKNNIGLSNRIDATVRKMDAEQRWYLNAAFPWLNWVNPVEEKASTSSASAASTAALWPAITILDKIKSREYNSYDALPKADKEVLEKYYGTGNAETNVTNYINQISNITQNTPKNFAHTWADAFKLTAAQLDIAVKSDPAWIEWAKWMVWWAVHTASWVRVVSVVPGTEMSASPIYEIMERDKYERQWFGETPENVTLDQFNAWKDSSNEEERNKYNKMTASFDKLQKQYNEFISTDGTKLEGDDKKNQYKNMEDFFDEKTLEWLRRFNPDKFKDKEAWEE